MDEIFESIFDGILPKCAFKNHREKRAYVCRNQYGAVVPICPPLLTTAMQCWTKAIIRVNSNTCVFPAITSQNGGERGV